MQNINNEHTQIENNENPEKNKDTYRLNYENLNFEFWSLEKIKKELDNNSITKNNYTIVKVKKYTRWWYNAKNKLEILKDKKMNEYYSDYCVYIKLFKKIKL